MKINVSCFQETVYSHVKTYQSKEYIWRNLIFDWINQRYRYQFLDMCVFAVGFRTAFMISRCVWIFKRLLGLNSTAFVSIFDVEKLPLGQSPTLF